MTQAISALCTLFIFVAACADGPATGGDRGRIRKVVQTTGDGTSSFLGWYDEQLDVPCAFAIASDGAMRCLPTEQYVVGVSRGYRDAGCTNELVFAAVTEGYCSVPKFMYTPGTTAQCVETPTGPAPSATPKVYRVIEPITRAFLRTSGGSCVAATLSNDLTYVAVEPDPAPTMFSEGTVAIE